MTARLEVERIREHFETARRAFADGLALATETVHVWGENVLINSYGYRDSAEFFELSWREVRELEAQDR
jgi:hypothetical protein